MLRRLADSTKSESLASRYRRRRFSLFMDLLSNVDKPVSILDVGGTQRYWEIIGLGESQGFDVTLLNMREQAVSLPNFTSVVGDAREMKQFGDAHFDVVFSNSVIEHVGSYEDQRRMAQEIRRVGRRYFIQTPNRYFPIEPHFLFPFFQFLPLGVRIWLMRHFDLGWYKRTPNYEMAKRAVENVRLLTKRELLDVFPGASLFEERVMGLSKSFMVYNGWA